MNRDDIKNICHSLASAIDPPNNRMGERDSGSPVTAPMHLITIREHCNINFHWWDDQFDILSAYRYQFPSLMNRGLALTQAQSHTGILSRTPTDEAQFKTKISSSSGPERSKPKIRHPLSDVTVDTSKLQGGTSAQGDIPSSKRRRTEPHSTFKHVSTILPMLPKFYYAPWPRQTHRLSFPGELFYNFPEDTAATLMNYALRMQSDDSIELGLYITAYIHQGETPLTIVPKTSIWNKLDKPHIVEITEKNVLSQVNVNDIRRAVCPYINFIVGLSKGFSTMMVRKRHWYVILLTEADILVSQMVKALVSVSQIEGMDQNDAASLMKEYEKCAKTLATEHGRLIAMDSIGYELDRTGWESVKKYMFICLVQVLSTEVCTAPVQESFGKFSEMGIAQQQVHFACLSFQVLINAIWPFRIFVSGPKQPDGRSCGAYGLTSVWKLSSREGYDEMHQFLCSQISCQRNETSMPTIRKSRNGNRYKPEGVPQVNFEAFYDQDLVPHVIRQFDFFIRKILKNMED